MGEQLLHPLSRGRRALPEERVNAPVAGLVVRIQRVEVAVRVDMRVVPVYVRRRVQWLRVLRRSSLRVMELG